MRSARPKHLHTLLGRRLVDWTLAAVRPLEPVPCVVVCSPEARDELAASLPEGTEIAVQAEPRGTGDAVSAAQPLLEGFEGNVLVVPGDAPLLTAELLERLVETHRREDAAVTLLTVETDRPLPYGRIVRDESGAVRRIVEERDASDEELAIRELNASVYVFAQGRPRLGPRAARPRQRTGRAVPDRHRRPPRRGRPPCRRARHGRRRSDARRQHAGRAGRRRRDPANANPPRRTCSRASRSSTPRPPGSRRTS